MSLKIIHTADWHLGQTFFGYDREEEHEAFLIWLVQVLVEQQTDVLLIAGDVFDVANPSASSQRRFFRFLREANKQNPGLQVVIIAGNHDSAARLEAPVPLLEELNTYIVGTIRRKEDRSIDFDSLLIPLYNRKGKREALCMAVPFLRQGDYPPSEEMQTSYIEGVKRMYNQLYDEALRQQQSGEAIVAMGHLHASGAELSEDDRSERIIMGGLESVGENAFHEGLTYTALGHIHKAQRVGKRENIRYAGSPLPMSFSETNYLHQVISIQINNGSLSIESIPVPKQVELIRVPRQPAVADEVLQKLSELPDTVEGDTPPTPFLEVRVLMTEPDPGFRHRVEEIIEKKAVRLTSIVPSYPNRDKEDSYRPLSYNDLQKIEPLDMLKQVFNNRYKDELPDDIAELFNEVLREVAL